MFGYYREVLILAIVATDSDPAAKCLAKGGRLKCLEKVCVEGIKTNLNAHHGNTLRR